MSIDATIDSFENKNINEQVEALNWVIRHLAALPKDVDLSRLANAQAQLAIVGNILSNCVVTYSNSETVEAEII